jgi:hypothetical protein
MSNRSSPDSDGGGIMMPEEPPSEESTQDSMSHSYDSRSQSRSQSQSRAPSRDERIEFTGLQLGR